MKSGKFWHKRTALEQCRCTRNLCGSLTGNCCYGEAGTYRLDSSTESCGHQNNFLPDDNSLYEIPLLDVLPGDWSTLSGPPTAVAYSDSFIHKGKHLGLIIPSAIIPKAGI